LEWSDITLATGVPDSFAGRTIAELPGDGADVVRELVATHPAATMIAGGRSEDDLLAVLGHPASVVGSDGFALDPSGPTGEGLTHPRSYGCYPRLLGSYVGPGRLTLEEAVAKCTSLPARRVGLDDRGVVAEGYAADLVVLDLDAMADRSTYVAPHAHPEGVEQVIVNGAVVVHNQDHAAASTGVVLRFGTDRRQSWHE
jgi:N-acyl-D-amino-acid deacylase